MADDSQLPPEAPIARAFDHALEAEHAAELAVAECERQTAEHLEEARRQRRFILERAQARIVALHGRAARAAEVRCAEIAEKHRQASLEVLDAPDHRERQAAALERLVARLTTPADGAQNEP